MPDFLQTFILTFVPLFIVIDAIGILPFVLALSEGLTKRQRNKLIHLATLTATIVGLVFLFFGQLILSVLDISVGSFAIAGGLILFVLSIKYILTGKLVEVAVQEEMVAVVPIGTPLVTGPATITTLLLLATQYKDNIPIVLLSFALNMLIAWEFFLMGNQIAGFLGKGGLRAVSNIFNLLLAVIAVSMIFRGLSLLGIISISS